MRIFLILLMLCGLVVGLEACALPDLVAHTVKEVEKSRRGDNSAQASNASSRSSFSCSRSAYVPVRRPLFPSQFMV